MPRKNNARKDVKSRVQAFNEVMSMSEKEWKTEYNAMRESQKARSGIYNPSTSTRDYKGSNTLRQKSMTSGYRSPRRRR